MTTADHKWSYVFDEPTRILVVDDDPILHEFAVVHLTAPLSQVETVPNAAAALELLGRASFDIVLVDIEMPGMDGFDLAEQLRADPRSATIPIIALSSITSPASIERGRQAGFHDFVAKFDRQGLIAALKESSVEWAEAA